MRCGIVQNIIKNVVESEKNVQTARFWRGRILEIGKVS